MYIKYVFSGHESFPCRMLWPIKGYDYIVEGNNFNDPNSVVELGVGKNMVASIRYWLKVLGLTEQDKSTPIANYLFDIIFCFFVIRRSASSLTKSKYRIM